MASALYTTSFGTQQGLAAGSSAVISVIPPASGCVVVIRQITAYFGGASPLLSNAIVVVGLWPGPGEPTLWAYNSGTGSGLDQIYEQFNGTIALPVVGFEEEAIPVLRVANVSTSPAAVDWSITGWALIGEPAITIGP